MELTGRSAAASKRKPNRKWRRYGARTCRFARAHGKDQAACGHPQRYNSERVREADKDPSYLSRHDGRAAKGVINGGSGGQRRRALLICSEKPFPKKKYLMRNTKSIREPNPYDTY